MAQIKSQMKRIITNEKARQRNVSIRSEVRTASKKVRVAVEAKDLAAAEQALLPRGGHAVCLPLHKRQRIPVCAFVR